MFQNKKEINFLGSATQIFQHAIALVAYKNQDTTVFLVADSWYGGNEYTKQRDAYVEDAVRALTMQDTNFYQWYGDYFLQEAKVYAQKGKANKQAGFWINALVAFKRSLRLYKKIVTPLTNQQKKDICYLAKIFTENKKLYNEIKDLGNKWWDDDIQKIEQSIKDLKIEC